MTLGAISQSNFILKTTNTNTLFASAQIKKSPVFTTFQTEKVNFNLKYNSDSYDNKMTGLVLLLGGVALTTAAILESGDGQIYKGEISRQIMLGTGIGLSLTGFGIAVHFSQR